MPIDDLSPKEFARQRIWEYGPVYSYYGVLVNKVHPIPQINVELKVFRFYNLLALTAYWNDKDSTLPFILDGETAIFYEDRIQEKINKSLSDCSEKGLAMYLSNELMGKRIFTMHPSVEECWGELWGVLTAKTYGELNQRELEALREERRTMADGG